MVTVRHERDLMARRSISNVLLKQARALVEGKGVTVTLEAPDGTKMTVAPFKAPAEELSPYDAWKRQQQDADGNRH